MRAFDSDHPLATETISTTEAEINAISFLLDCDRTEAKRWQPFFSKTLELAEAKKARLRR